MDHEPSEVEIVRRLVQKVLDSDADVFMMEVLNLFHRRPHIDCVQWMQNCRPEPWLFELPLLTIHSCDDPIVAAEGMRPENFLR